MSVYPRVEVIGIQAEQRIEEDGARRELDSKREREREREGEWENARD